MIHIQSFLCDTWQVGSGIAEELRNPSTEEIIATTCTTGLDFRGAFSYARSVGGANIRALTFAQRGELLTKMAAVLHEKREYLLDVSRDCNGATRGDSKFDVDGATATLSSYGRYGEKMGDGLFQVDGEANKISANARQAGQHIRLPRHGVAFHINAFNFPAWGTFEKIAVAFLAGMPVVTKPASTTALLTYEMIKIIVEADFLPKGVLSFIAGDSGDIIDHLEAQDVVAFTGSAKTAAKLRASQSVVHKSVRFNAEADSLNTAILAPDVEVGSDIWYRFINNVLTDIRQKAGQKCTASRRLLVPEDLVEAVQDALVERLAEEVVGYPIENDVTIGPVVSQAQLQDVCAGIQELATHGTIACGGGKVQGKYAPEGKGFFVAPTVIVANDAFAEVFHTREVFGPCTSVLPYDGSTSMAMELLKKGEGCLVSAVYTDDRKWLQEILLDSAVWNGRLFVVSGKVADVALTPSTVLANQVHGGPGRAGGGLELGGLRGLDLYTNCVAIQGDRTLLGKLLGITL